MWNKNKFKPVTETVYCNWSITNQTQRKAHIMMQTDV